MAIWSMFTLRTGSGHIFLVDRGGGKTRILGRFLDSKPGSVSEVFRKIARCVDPYDSVSWPVKVGSLEEAAGTWIGVRDRVAALRSHIVVAVGVRPGIGEGLALARPMAVMSVMVSTLCILSCTRRNDVDKMKSLRSSFGKAKKSQQFRQTYPRVLWTSGAASHHCPLLIEAIVSQS
jgi:hypothetical protein